MRKFLFEKHKSISYYTHGQVASRDITKASVVDFLMKLGYSNLYEDLNAKDFGVPQNRDRCFMVSLLGKYDFVFPKGIPLEKVIVDVLEDEVEEKFFIRSEKAKLLIDQLIKDGKIEE